MARTPTALAPFDDFSESDGIFDVPRVTALAVSPDGRRLIAAIQQPDEHGARYTSALWQLDPDGVAPARRLTFSTQGESAPRFAPDGTLLFSSRRPDPQNPDGKATGIWRLPEHGEAGAVTDSAGGVGVAGIAGDGRILATTSVLAMGVAGGGELEGDADRRQHRKDAGVTGILHTGMPIRYWDHELDDISPRLVLVDPATGALTDLTPGADTLSLLNAQADLSPDGSTVATTWTTRVRDGRTIDSLVLIDTARRRRRNFLRGTAAHGFGRPLFSPVGDRIAVLRETVSTPTDTNYDFLEIHPVPHGRRRTPDPVTVDPVPVDVGDLTVGEYAWSATGDILFVAGDLHSRGAVLAVDPVTGRSRTLADDAAYSELRPSPDGKYVFALRSGIDSPARPVRLTVKRRTPPRTLLAPGAVGALPGTLEWVSTDVDGLEIGGWLCTPHDASTKKPAPLMVWIHGGPHASYNSWSWRWCPWLAVARGYAVLMPDPAMSTGYGHAGLNRGWPRLADVVWREVEALTDSVLRRRTLDRTRTALLGASFGGFMTNWIAGHSRRFDAIVTHAGLWALDQQHPTTDAAAHKVAVHRTPDELPQWYRQYSPHHHAGNIRTPMLVTHGTRDYRVPVSEALRLWWDLVSGWTGRPEDLPHRFLQFTDENHWILGANNSRLWVRTVLDFCDRHVRGIEHPDSALQ